MVSLRPTHSLASVTSRVPVALRRFPWSARIRWAPEWYILHFIAYHLFCAAGISYRTRCFLSFPQSYLSNPILIHSATVSNLNYWNTTIACALTNLSPLESVLYITTNVNLPKSRRALLMGSSCEFTQNPSMSSMAIKSSGFNLTCKTLSDMVLGELSRVRLSHFPFSLLPFSQSAGLSVFWMRAYTHPCLHMSCSLVWLTSSLSPIQWNAAHFGPD